MRKENQKNLKIVHKKADFYLIISGMNVFYYSIEKSISICLYYIFYKHTEIYFAKLSRKQKKTIQIHLTPEAV